MELNRLNGELIHLRMSHNAQMLEVLLAANRQDLYGADGQTSARRPAASSTQPDPADCLPATQEFVPAGETL